jgi:N,N'-diacetyllegionaminate synthase
VKRVKLGKKWIGEGEPVYIIAEAGSNHNGSFEQAQRLIEVAAEAGADAVKFQMFRAEALYPRRAGTSDYLASSRSIYEILHDAEMPPAWIPHLAAYSCERGIDFLSTPFDEGSADFIIEYLSAY